ncbi:hypothetical protein, partial [Pseudomonas sp. 2822-17]|uniref:hypothetical protein n=1 Tax=Pseudomonas sp. 2822-17 TaxID=1712678 RepID=UPI001C4727CE
RYMSRLADNYLKENREKLLAKLNDFLSIPSVSTDSKHKGDVVKAGEFVDDYLKDIGFNSVELQETPGHPLVYGEWLEAEGAPTVLL